jgi:cobalt-zinc-cadmium efflux system protein
MGHDHGHATGRAQDRARLRWVLAITSLILVVELFGAYVAGSLALLADAGHLATDAGAIVLALSASYLATRPATTRSTFGWHRAEVLAAAVNALVLLGVCVFLAVAGVRRLLDPATVDAAPMVAFAVVGLAANATALAILSRGDTYSLNMRGALMEVAGDLVGSTLAVIAGLVIWATGFNRADALASLAIAVLILPRAVTLLRDSTAVLLERTPPGLELDDVRTHLLDVDGVIGVHDLHAWTITSGLSSLSAHVTVHDDALANRGIGAVLDELSDCVAEHFEVHHATFQVEPESHREHENLGGAGCD